MGDWFRHIALNAKARTGLGPQLVVWFLVAAVSLTLALAFFCVAAFVWLAGRYDPLTAGLILGGVFLALAIIAAIAGWMARQRNVERARIELAARSNAGWLHPKFLAIGIDSAARSAGAGSSRWRPRACSRPVPLRNGSPHARRTTTRGPRIRSRTRLAVSEVRLALSNFYNIAIRIANVAARFAVFVLAL